MVHNRLRQIFGSATNEHVALCWFYISFLMTYSLQNNGLHGSCCFFDDTRLQVLRIIPRRTHTGPCLRVLPGSVERFLSCCRQCSLTAAALRDFFLGALEQPLLCSISFSIHKQTPSIPVFDVLCSKRRVFHVWNFDLAGHREAPPLPDAMGVSNFPSSQAPPRQLPSRAQRGSLYEAIAMIMQKRYVYAC